MRHLVKKLVSATVALTLVVSAISADMIFFSASTTASAASSQAINATTATAASTSYEPEVKAGVRDQKSYGACWAFAATAMAEYNMLHRYSEDELKQILGVDASKALDVANDLNFSEGRLCWFFAGAPQETSGSIKSDLLSEVGKGTGAYDEGGNGDVTYAMLTRAGLSLGKNSPENDEVFQDSYDESERYDTLVKAASYTKIEREEWTTQAAFGQAMKNAIIQNGAAVIGYNLVSEEVTENTTVNGKNVSTYYSGTATNKGTSHAVTIIGWDDDFPSSAFLETPAGNGAWLCQNSYGTGAYTDGYFWMSYYEYARIVEAYSFSVVPTDTYDNTYQHDGRIGDTMTAGSVGAELGINVYTAEADEEIVAVGFPTPTLDDTYTVYIYSDMDFFYDKEYQFSENKQISIDKNMFYDSANYAATVTGSANSNYQIVNLEQPVSVRKGEKYGVAIKFHWGGIVTDSASEGADCSYAVMVRYGDNIYDLAYKYNNMNSAPRNVCLKAFTNNQVVEAPTFTTTDSVFTGTINVGLTCATEDAKIYYTTDGTNPTVGSTLYTGTPFTISEATTVKAFAVKDGMENSSVVSKDYVVVKFGALENAAYGTSSNTAITINKPEGAGEYTVVCSTANANLNIASDYKISTNSTLNAGNYSCLATVKVTFGGKEYTVTKEYAFTVAPCTHEETEVRNKTGSNCDIVGYTGDTYCVKCGQMITEGEIVAATGHAYVNGKCTKCNDVDPEYFTTDEGTVNWIAVNETVAVVEEGEQLVVAWKTGEKVPETILGNMKGKDVELVLNMGDGISWAINGKTVSETKDVDLTVSSTTTIPEAIVGSFQEVGSIVPLAISHNGEFGFEAVLTVEFDDKDEGAYANLFYYNSATGEMEFQRAVLIQDKKAGIPFTHASEYLIVVSEQSMENQLVASNTENPTVSQEGAQTPDTGDHFPAEMLAWIAVAFLAMVGAGTKKRQVR